MSVRLSVCLPRTWVAGKLRDLQQIWKDRWKAWFKCNNICQSHHCVSSPSPLNLGMKTGTPPKIAKKTHFFTHIFHRSAWTREAIQKISTQVILKSGTAFLTRPTTTLCLGSKAPYGPTNRINFQNLHFYAKVQLQTLEVCYKFPNPTNFLLQSLRGI